jgi:thiol-disulfide isomerase/thioredoxin
MNTNRRIERSAQLLPFFEFLTLENVVFSTKDLKKYNQKVIINFFSPSCEHCQYMAKQYLKNKELFKGVTILMITISDSSELAKFNKDYQLKFVNNIILLRDTKFQFFNIFETTTVPSFFVYKNKILVHKIIGETKIENLLN